MLRRWRAKGRITSSRVGFWVWPTLFHEAFKRHSATKVAKAAAVASIRVATGAVGAAKQAAEAAEAVKEGVSLDVFGNASTERFVSVRATRKLTSPVLDFAMAFPHLWLL